VPTYAQNALRPVMSSRLAAVTDTTASTTESIIAEWDLTPHPLFSSAGHRDVERSAFTRAPEVLS